MTPAELSAAVATAVADAVTAGELVGAVPGEVVVERPKNREHGDYATNVALRLASAAGRSPRDVAELLAQRLRATDGVATVEVAGPGFLNITFAAAALGQVARDVVTAGPRYGVTDTLAGEVINVEYVSANPVGPVHIGSVRWAAVGDAIANLLAAGSAEVVREYYFNDAGAQIDRFAASLDAVARGEAVPSDGYQGDYIAEVAGEVVAANPGLLELPRDKAVDVFRRDGVQQMFDRIKASLESFGVRFDVYFNERDLHASGAIEATVKRLRDSGRVYENDGAVWLRTTDFGDDKDRVIVRSDGRPTYFNADLAYYLDKRSRGAHRVVIILGADHHGYVGRLRGMVAGLGEDPDRTLEVIIGQMVNLRGGKMSKRAGQFVTLEDLVAAIGVDAARYALVRSSMDSAIDLDLDLWARRSNDNPVFYVQYAHARLSSLQRSAADLGISRSTDPDLGLLDTDQEAALLTALADFPRVIATAAELRAPHRVARYLEELAGLYHRFYDACRVLPQGEEKATPLTDARLWLSEATRVVLANGLGLLGVGAPERM